ncbi:ATP-binding protein [Epilithonimonas sp.]|uniref:sensor histidine kinase n=1 Tax=Epilithonimonas sp. TaxID=2894511 RepID=UPI0035B357E7
MINYYFKEGFSKIRILRNINDGVLDYKYEPFDKNKRQIHNSISILLYYLNLSSTILYIFVGLYWESLLVFGLSMAEHLIRTIKRKNFLMAKIAGAQVVYLFFFLSGMVYGYTTALNHFYIIYIVVGPLFFTNKEVKYLLFVIVEGIGLFLLQSMYGDHLFCFHQLRPEKVELFNYLVLSKIIIYMFSLTFLYIFMNQYQERKLKKIKANLNSAKQKLFTENNELRTFGMAATHSLKTPLFIINSFLTKIKDNLENSADRTASKYYINLIKDSNKMNEKYSNDLITYSLIYGTDNKFEMIDLKEMINKNTPIFSLKYKKSKIINEVKNNCIIYSNAKLLDIIIQNLVDNGLKYNISKTPMIKIFTTKEDKKIYIFVEDNGIGISEEYKTKIFEPFNRINQIDSIPGSGLGLSFANLATLKINSELNLVSGKNGCIFRLSIPF